VLADLKLAELNLAEANWSLTVFIVSGIANPLTKTLALLISI